MSVLAAFVPGGLQAIQTIQEFTSQSNRCAYRNVEVIRKECEQLWEQRWAFGWRSALGAVVQSIAGVASQSMPRKIFFAGAAVNLISLGVNARLMKSCDEEISRLQAVEERARANRQTGQNMSPSCLPFLNISLWGA